MNEVTFLKYKIIFKSENFQLRKCIFCKQFVVKILCFEVATLEKFVIQRMSKEIADW